ncbi:MAG: hypothetical protein K2K54_04405 [Lachnospiraceae bacterium]|nr:hypothetical protein [Lachnospiraceae bacterium]
MNELIERMKADGMHTAVIKDWYERMTANIQKYHFLKENGQGYIDTIAYTETQKRYENLIGFLWGLTAAGYITPEQNDKYVEELIENTWKK